MRPRASSSFLIVPRVALSGLSFHLEGVDCATPASSQMADMVTSAAFARENNKSTGLIESMWDCLA